MNKFDKLIELCKQNIPLSQEIVGDDMIFIDRGSFQLIIPKDGNTDEHGDFFVCSKEGHDCLSKNIESTHVYNVIDGEGTFIVDGKDINVNQGSSIVIPPNTPFTYKGKMIMTFTMEPNFKEENDVFIEKITYNKED